MSEHVIVPGGRDVRGTRDGSPERAAKACVVACPPHPRHRGHRGDERLTAVSDALVEREVDCLRFDYGEWDEGRGELADVRNALAWADERYDRLGLFGYSFGGCLALLAAGGVRPTGEVTDPPPLRAVSALAPTARIGEGLDATATMDRIDCPGQVVYGARDDTADWRPVVDRAGELGWSLAERSADHFFVGQAGAVGALIGGFLADRLRPASSRS